MFQSYILPIFVISLARDEKPGPEREQRGQRDGEHGQRERAERTEWVSGAEREQQLRSSRQPHLPPSQVVQTDSHPAS